MIRGIESPRLEDLGAYVVVLETEVMNTKTDTFE